MALPAPTTLIDALPYVDSQFNDAKMKQRVDQLVQAEMETFAPRDYVAHLPQYEPNFEVRARGAATYWARSSPLASVTASGPSIAAGRVDAHLRSAADVAHRYLTICARCAARCQAGRPASVAPSRRECRGTTRAPKHSVRPSRLFDSASLRPSPTCPLQYRLACPSPPPPIPPHDVWQAQ
jgi:hypothetical protein